ncbi:uncharacterized protein LOC123693694 [Colias croceus]|uniref:uncharacterized protein LOC123693694 n=1 Tax=Colias crocea TaxID=72248 RepID=UPI001E27CFAA|nr:uncharacterized protein LOC123693694 [Colias croceus]
MNTRSRSGRGATPSVSETTATATGTSSTNTSEETSGTTETSETCTTATRTTRTEEKSSSTPPTPSTMPADKLQPAPSPVVGYTNAAFAAPADNADAPTTAAFAAPISNVNLNTDAALAAPSNVAVGSPARRSKTLRQASEVRSRRSVASRKRLLAELEAKERLAELKLEQAKAAAELEKARLERIRAEEESTTEEEEEDYEPERRVESWLKQHSSQPLPPAANPTRELSPPRYIAKNTDNKEDRGWGARQEQDDGQREPKKDPPTRSPEVAAIVTAFNEVARSQRKVIRYGGELPTFTGSSNEWLSFKASYEETEEGFTDGENVARLRKALKGAALEAVTALLISHTGPEKIIEALQRRFGRPDALVLGEMEKIKSLPRVSDNPRDVCIFANKIANIVATVEILGKPEYLHSPEMLRQVLEKLTPIMKNKWYDFAADERDKTPLLKKLAEFLNKEADKCSSYAPLDTETERITRKRTERAYAASNASERETRCPVCEREHKLIECRQFTNSDVNTRWEIAKKHRVCFRCLRSKHQRATCRARPCGLNGCTMKHHKMLHHTKTAEKKNEETTQPQAETKNDEKVLVSAININSATSEQPTRRRAYLKIAPITITGPKGKCDTYALLDEGSTVTIIETALAEQLGLDGPRESITIQGVNGHENEHEYSKRVKARVRGRHEENDYVLDNARTVHQLHAFTQSIHESDIARCNHLHDLQDDLLYENATPKLLIGQDNWELIITRKLRHGKRSQPVASKTLLGWVLHGCRSSNKHPVLFCSHLSEAEKSPDTLENMMKKYFELESIGIEPKRQRSDPEQQALNILEKKSQRLPSGRYETGLLWRDESADTPNNYGDTLKRLKTLEKKLDKDGELKRQYEERIENLLSSGYAEKAQTPPTGGRVWYLPHFPVINPDKAKIRLVHDAAAKSHGRSLNDMLLPGPDLLQSLPAVIMKFRQHPIAVSADIKEMFMQIKIIEEDRDALRFLWRGDRRDDGPPDEYRMTSLIFGASSSPCTALYIKNRNAQEHANESPAAARAIQENHYMDDYIHSYATEDEAKEITAHVDRIHRYAGFELRGWASNKENAIRNFTNTGATTVEIGGSETERTLGLLWHVKQDYIGFRVNTKRVPQEIIENKRTPTKREALSLIMSVFDPLGLIAPILTPAKRIMQDTWKYNTGWDDPIPDALQHRWENWVANIQHLDALRIPRCYDYEPAAEREIHTFVDASEEAYAAVVYIRATRADGSIHIAIAAAKSRVTPTKPVSIPRLELQAALLGARLTRTVEEGHDFVFKRKVYWSDSRTALAWIRGEPRTYKTFVAHRLAEIEDLTKKDEWRWVPTAHNTADDATRNTPADFDPQHRWFTGPDFLRYEECDWPVEKKENITDTGEEKEKCGALNSSDPAPAFIDLKRFSTWTRLVRTTARVLQFIELCRRPKQLVNATRRKRTRKNEEKDVTWKRNTKKNKEKIVSRPNNEERKYIILSARHLRAAENVLVKLAQQATYGKEIAILQRGDPLTEKCQGPLAGLSVALNEEGILKLRGRVNEASAIEAEAANPTVLDGKHKYTQLYIQHVHEKLHHGGVEIVVNELRQRLWITRIRPATKEVLKSCPRCRLLRAKPARPSTGDLPAARLAHHARPFTFTGLDYFGPQEVTVGRHREKRYVALFTCLTSRAVHLEVVASLSTDSAINALRRFIARRGCPAEIWSDNATCFRAANRELTDAWAALEEEAAARRISWRFLPPAAPFMAGAWERMVRTVKEALRHTLHEQHPSDETLVTLLAEVEATVNSRPLTHVAVTPDVPPAITPNMILLGSNCYVPPPCTIEEDQTTARTHWKRAQQLADTFWRRWVREYLPVLQQRREPHASGAAPKIGDQVIVCDSNHPRNTWPRGRVIATYPGKDGEVRVVDVETSGGRILRRPTKKIVVLPVRIAECDGGRNVHDET